MRNACMKHLAKIKKMSVMAIKWNYGPNLDKNTAVPFISNRRIDRIFNKLRAKYEKRKHLFLEAGRIEIEKEANSQNKFFLLLVIGVCLVSLFVVCLAVESAFFIVYLEILME